MELDAGPFDLGDGPDAALCLHGLTGMPFEVRPIGEALAARGVRAVGPMLPGHGETHEALARAAHTDWLDAVASAHRALRSRHERVFLVGLSLGGLLALCHAAEAEVDALAVIGAPLRLGTRAIGVLATLADIYFRDKRIDEAAELIARARQIDRNDPRVLLEQAALTRLRGDTQGAETLLR
jgi:esterase/lipase